MELSYFLARAWGLYILIISLALLINKQNLPLIYKIFRNDEALFLSGFANIAIGALMIASHNIWTSDWRIILTLLGWVALVKGTLRLLYPELTTPMLRKLKRSNSLPILLILSSVLGLYLLYIGFSAS